MLPRLLGFQTGGCTGPSLCGSLGSGRFAPQPLGSTAVLSATRNSLARVQGLGCWAHLVRLLRPLCGQTQPLLSVNNKCQQSSFLSTECFPFTASLDLSNSVSRTAGVIIVEERLRRGMTETLRSQIRASAGIRISPFFLSRFPLYTALCLG